MLSASEFHAENGHMRMRVPPEWLQSIHTSRSMFSKLILIQFDTCSIFIFERKRRNKIQTKPTKENKLYIN